MKEERLDFVSSLFSGKEQHQNLNRVHEFFPKNTLSASLNPMAFLAGEPKKQRVRDSYL